MTFCESNVRLFCLTVTDAVAPSGTALNSRVAACALSFW